MEMEGWEFAKGVKEVTLRRFTREGGGEAVHHSYLCLSSELPSKQRKVGGNNWTLSACFSPFEKGKGF